MTGALGAFELSVLVLIKYLLAFVYLANVQINDIRTWIVNLVFLTGIVNFMETHVLCLFFGPIFKSISTGGLLNFIRTAFLRDLEVGRQI